MLFQTCTKPTLGLSDVFVVIIKFMRNHVMRHSIIWELRIFFAKYLRTIQKDVSLRIKKEQHFKLLKLS